MSMTYTKAQFAEKHKEAISLFQAGLQGRCHCFAPQSVHGEGLGTQLALSNSGQCSWDA